MQCIQCSKEFNSERSTAKFCSDTCRSVAFRKVSVAENLSVAPVSVTEPVFTPNWQRLSRQYPDKIKSKKDALAFILFSLSQNHPEATFCLGGRMYGAVDKESGTAPVIPQWIDKWLNVA